MEKAMDIKDFTCLLLAKVADKSKLVDLMGEGTKIACLPNSYKEIIEKIMDQGNVKNNKFSALIDVEEYFDDNYEWEDKFSRCLREVLKEMKKKVDYDFVFDRIEIIFTKDEIAEILSRYTDENINNKTRRVNIIVRLTVLTH